MRYVIPFICLMFSMTYGADQADKEIVIFRAMLQTETLEKDVDIFTPTPPNTPRKKEPEDTEVKKACSKTKIAILTGVTSLVGTGVTVATILLTQYAQSQAPGAPGV